MMWTLLMVWLGCTCADPPARGPLKAKDKPRAPAGSRPLTLKKPEPAPSQSLPAPSRAVFGLEVGKSTHADVMNWSAARSIDCGGVPSPTRATWRYECADDLAADTLPGRTIQPKGAMVVMSRLDDGPLHSINSLRRYSVPADALADYERTRVSIVGTLGDPIAAQERAPDPDKLSGQHFHYQAIWGYQNLSVRLALQRAGGAFINVFERWEIPDVESKAPARPGAVGHGGHGSAASEGPHSPHGVVE